MIGKLKKCYGFLLGAGVVEAASHLPETISAPELSEALHVTVPALAVATSLLPNLASNKIAEAEQEEFAARNHHLRMGMAEALRTALQQTHRDYTNKGIDPTLDALFKHWDTRLAGCQDRTKLDLIVPEISEKDLFDASSGKPDLNQGSQALGELLFNWLTSDPHLAAQWTPEQARDLARDILPHYFAAFKQAAINDHQAHLFQAFVVNGMNVLIQRGPQIIDTIETEGDKTRKHVSDQTEVILDEIRQNRAPGETAIPSDWRPPSLFLGRDEQLEHLERALVTPHPNATLVFSIQGLPGVGKSLLCEYFAFHHQQDFPGGYARITLDPAAPKDTQALLQDLAARFDIKGEAAVVETRLQNRLRDPRSLVHIENVDSRETGQAVAGLVRRLAQCSIMISGRFREFGATQGWSQVPVAPFGPVEAFQQLTQELGRPPHNPEERRDWQTLLERCGYLPLAIHLSAGQLRAGLSVSEILPNLLSLEASDPADPLFEQNARASLGSSFEISWNAFVNQATGQSQPEWAEALCAFAAAPLSGVGIDLAAAICGLDPLPFKRMIDQAARLSLVVKESGEVPRWRAHALIRAFLTEKSPSALESGEERQSRWFLQRLPYRGDSDDQLSDWRQIAAEENALSAWLMALPSEAAQIVCGLANHYADSHGPARVWLGVARESLRSEREIDVWAAACLTAAESAERLGDPEASLHLSRSLLERAEALPAPRWIALASGKIADILTARGQLDEALRIRQQEELPVFEKLGDIRSRAVTQGQIDIVYLQQGKFSEADHEMAGAIRRAICLSY